MITVNRHQSHKICKEMQFIYIFVQKPQFSSEKLHRINIITVYINWDDHRNRYIVAIVHYAKIGIYWHGLELGESQGD